MTDPILPASEADVRRLLTLAHEYGMMVRRPARDVLYRDRCYAEGLFVAWDEMVAHLVEEHAAALGDATNLVRVLRIVSRQHELGRAK